MKTTWQNKTFHPRFVLVACGGARLSKARGSKNRRFRLQVFLVFLSFVGTFFAQTNTAFQYFYDDLGQLTKVVDSTGTVIEYVYDPVGNILQIRRSTIAPGTLAIFNFTPQSGGPAQTVSMQGQGFDPIPANNVVQFNGTAASVLAASSTNLTAAVPLGATTGPISVTVAGQTATSTNGFTVIPSPVITAISCKSALFNKVIPSLQVSGINLGGAIFAFAPAFGSPAITVTAASIDPLGTSAVLSLQVGAQAGTFVLVATNPAGSSSALVSPSNRFTVVDPRSTADTNGNGFPDVFKAASCLDPLDPNSIPKILPVPEADSLTVSLLNGAAPPHASPSAVEANSLTVSLLNGAAPPQTQTQPQLKEADSLTVSLVNGVAPPRTSPTAMEADGLTVSLLNGVLPPAQPAIQEADSLTISLFNSAPKTMRDKRGGGAIYASLHKNIQNSQKRPNSRKRFSAKPVTAQAGTVP